MVAGISAASQRQQGLSLGTAPSVLFLGPVSGQVTGQQQAFKTLVESTTLSAQVVDFGFEGLSAADKLRSTLGAVFEAIAVLFRSHPDAVYIATSRTLAGSAKDLIVLSVCRLLRIPVVNHLHGDDFDTFRDSLSRPFRLLLDAAYRAVATSIVLAGRMGRHYLPYASFMTTEVVENSCGLRTNEIQALERPDRQGPLRVLFLSSLTRDKGVLDLIEAFRIVSGQLSPGSVELVLAGPFSARRAQLTEEEFRSITSDLTQLTYLGSLGTDEKWQQLLSADVVVLPSYREASPLCLIEGIVAGCFPIATDVGYCRELLEGTEHVLLEDHRPTSIADALTTVARSPKRLELARRRNREIGKRRFASERYVNRIDEIVKSVRPGNSRSAGAAGLT